jgi:DNA-binding transcriptional regulator YdaS (Cro superfamily)
MQIQTNKAIDLAGSAKELADLLSITQSAVSQWGEYLPKARVWQLMAIRPAWFACEKTKAEA